MKVNRIKIKGYKNIEETELNLNKITCLLSQNSYGKSNVLQAIDFGIRFMKKVIDEKELMLLLHDCVPLSHNNSSKGQYSFEVEFSTEIKKQRYEVIYGYTVAWPKKDDNGKINEEYLKIKATKDTQKYESVIKRKENNALYKSSKTASCDKKISIDNHELVINKLQAFDNLYYIDIIRQINRMDFYIDRNFDVSQKYDIINSLRSQKGDINNALYKLKEENNDKYQRLINTFKDLFPFIEIIDIVESDFKLSSKNSTTIRLVLVKDKNLSEIITFDNMSDGAKRVLTTLIYLTIADIQKIPLIALEEPENSVHPRLLQHYLIVLDSFVENSKIIITSHSPQLINYVKPQDLYLGIPNEHRLAKFCKIRNNAIKRLMKDANNQNLYLGDYLFDLMSGNEDDIEVLSSYVE